MEINSSMGKEEAYSVKWMAFESDVSQGLSSLLEEEAMVDVTLIASGGTSFTAHKVVLSVSSTYFRSIFQTNPCQHPVIIFKDVDPQVLKNTLEFIYKGEVDVQHEELPSFIDLAEALKIKGLSGEKTKEKLATPQSHYFKRKSTSNEFDSGKEEPVARKRTRTKYARAAKSVVKVVVKEEDYGGSLYSDSNCSLGNLGSDTHCGDDDENPEPIKYKNLDVDFVDVSEDLNAEEDSKNDEASSHVKPAGDGGVDYQMIKTTRGRDMLLHNGYTFVVNKKLKDGVRWGCSNKNSCKAFCHMSNAGWLTPFHEHNHEKPSELVIKKRILRMEVKARAESSGATAKEILRSTLPAEEFESSDRLACYSKCIQRVRKVLNKKKNNEDSTLHLGTEDNVLGTDADAEPSKPIDTEETWNSVPLHMIKDEDSDKMI